MLQKDYNEKVYAGVLGKVIGVYAGKPFEGWEFDNVYQIRLDVKDNKLTGSITGEVLIEGNDSDFEDGRIALVLNEGRSFTNNVKVQGI